MIAKKVMKRVPKSGRTHKRLPKGSEKAMNSLSYFGIGSEKSERGRVAAARRNKQQIKTIRNKQHDHKHKPSMYIYIYIHIYANDNNNKDSTIYIYIYISIYV